MECLFNNELTGLNDELTELNDERTGLNDELTGLNDELTGLNDELKHKNGCWVRRADHNHIHPNALRFLFFSLDHLSSTTTITMC